MLIYQPLSYTVDEIKEDIKYHTETLVTVNELLSNLENDKKHLEERIRFDNIRLLKLTIESK